MARGIPTTSGDIYGTLWFQAFEAEAARAPNPPAALVWLRGVMLCAAFVVLWYGAVLDVQRRAATEAEAGTTPTAHTTLHAAR